eukprot:TRINITY_DN3388_c0_g1_i1.p1 TRINITY_DN3388_c0_g1~~TRINITY_DN3388_c0_g1_i1.p1  ORF type:complete len:124 (+),score=33.30 TRINITY_DN3388_c0_g1_i1:54-425(+)
MSSAEHHHSDSEEEFEEQGGDQKSPFRLDVSNANSDRERERLAHLGDDVKIIFHLPDGAVADARFKMGHSVEVLKGYVEANFNIPYANHALYLNNELMFDPLSLNDFPGIDPAQDLHVTVQNA